MCMKVDRIQLYILPQGNSTDDSDDDLDGPRPKRPRRLPAFERCMPTRASLRQHGRAGSSTLGHNEEAPTSSDDSADDNDAAVDNNDDSSGADSDAVDGEDGGSNDGSDEQTIVPGHGRGAGRGRG